MKLFYYSKGHKFKIFLVIILIFLISLTQSFFPFINKILIDDVFGEGQFNLLPKLIFGIALAAIVYFALNIAKQLIITFISQKITIEIKNDLISQIRELSFSEYNKKSIGEYLSIFQSDLSLITNILNNILPNFITIIQQLLITSTILILLNPKLLMIVIILIPINLGVNLFFLKPINKLSQKIQLIISDITEKTQESLMNTKEIIGFLRKDWDIQRLNQVNLRLLPVQLKREFISASSSNVNFIIYWFVFIIIVYFGGKQVQNGEMSLGTLIVFITYLMGLFGPISILLNLNVEFQRCLGGAKRVFELFDNPKEVIHFNEIKTDLFPIVLEGVSLSYGHDKSVLNNIALEINKGETIAIIGKSGEGKTTLINILLGFWFPQVGTMTINGTNIRQLNLKSYLDKIAVVFQDSNLFSGTIKENIQFGNLLASQDDIIHAAKSASAHDFIENLPLGYETVIGQKFINLSGGQKQRIAIARALVKKPQLLILDEATSGLDYLTERKIDFTMERDQTTLIITHRLESLKGADKIYMLNNGGIIQFSSYDEAIGNMVVSAGT